MLYRTQQWLSWDKNVCKTCFLTVPPCILKPCFGSSFSSLSNWFNMSVSKNAQETGPYIWRAPWRDYIYLIQLATFIMQNRCIHIIRRCTSCRTDMDEDEFHSYTAKGSLTIRCSDRFWGGVWSGHRTGIGMPKTFSGGLNWGCGIPYNTLAKFVCALPFCIPQCTHLSSVAGKLKLLVSMMGHLTTKTWDQHNRHICGSSSRGSKLIYCFFSVMVVILFHCLLVLLVTPKWIVTMQRKQASSSNRRRLAKASLLPKMKRNVMVIILEAMTSSIVVHGQDGTVSPQ